MFYKLHEKLYLRGWEKLPYAVVEKGVSRPLFIKDEEMKALQLCNGLIDVSLPLIPQETRDLLKIIEEKGFIKRCERGDAIRPEQEYRIYPARYIRTAHWSITGRCNYRCKHCYMSAPDAKQGELDHDTIMSIVQQLIDCGVREVSLTGGEPLVRKDFLEIVDALINGGITITTIYSNGKLVTDKLLDELASRDIHPEFNMSYDGVDGWHDWLRGIPNAGKIVEDAFLRCRKKGFPTGAEMCIHNGNKRLLRKTVSRLAELGCRSLKTNPISNVGAWKEGGYGESISLDELYQTYLDYIPEFYEDGMPLSLQLGGFFSVNLGRGVHLGVAGCGGIPVQIQYHTDFRMFFQNGLNGLPGIGIRTVVRRIVMKLPVVDDPNACRFQPGSQGITDGDHIITFVQGPVICGFCIHFPGGGSIAFRGMGMDDQNFASPAGQIP